MADLTPAEELRAAAARLRCKHTYPLLPPHSLWAPGPCEKCGTPYDDVPRDVPEWLREPLAEWLEEAARQADTNANRSPRRRPPPHALAVARVIRGGGRG